MFSLQKYFIHKAPKGLTLPEYKTLSNQDGSIKPLPLYNKYYISLLQRDSEQSIATVSIGDTVKKGDIIARPTSRIALYCHAPTSGKITGIVKITESHPSAMTANALEITADGLDTPTDNFPPINHYHLTDKEQILERILRAGITGMGGAGFPTEKKINLQNPIETLIINGAECEPYLTCDDLLMRHYAEEILRGAEILSIVLSAKRIIVGIEDNKPEAISAMQAVAKKHNQCQRQRRNNIHKNKKHKTTKQEAKTDQTHETDAIPNKTILSNNFISIVSLPTKYPIGSRHQIAHFLLGQKSNIHKRSHHSKFICHNVSTAKAVFDAVVLGKPLTERLITFSGNNIKKPGVYSTYIGTTIADITQGIGISHASEITIGGTMMGFSLDASTLTNRKRPMTIKREMTALLAFKTQSPQQTSTEQNCIRCGYCADVCPMNLLPQQLQFYGKGEKYAQVEQNHLFDCIECGLCTYVCPSDIPLVEIFQHSKGKILAKRQKKQLAEQAQSRFETRNTRLADEKTKCKRKSTKPRRLKYSHPLLDTAKNPIQNTIVNNHDKSDLIAKALARAQAKKIAHQSATIALVTDE
ncbi:MAG: 4Fe-4S dicluster domain-containing protein [Ostreibacterium sp.]